jgi:hypothetical protein
MFQATGGHRDPPNHAEYQKRILPSAFGVDSAPTIDL